MFHNSKLVNLLRFGPISQCVGTSGDDEVPHPIEQEPSCQLSLYEQSPGLNYTLEIVIIKIQMNVLRTFGGRVHLRLF